LDQSAHSPLTSSINKAFSPTGKQKSITENSTRQTLQIRNKLRLQFRWAQQNSTTEDWENVAWSDGINNMKVWIYPALFQQFRLLVV